jgi:nitroimidazol reductase NimA-like FMN-containing flavoprotein (pyridoxamine 5'-phosphate oxidase superfamily)
MESKQPTERTRVRRLPKRASYEAGAIYTILDEGLVCHVGFAIDGQPYVIPTTYARIGDQLYLHGSAASRMLRTLAGSVPVCVTVTLLDGLVLARSAFHHSMNYRSVVVLGTATEVVDPTERLAALEAIVEHMRPGRWRDVRPPSEQELRATAVLRLPLAEASAKLRTGPPLDDDDDLTRGCWAGEIPLRLTPQAPVADPQLPPGTALPAPTLHKKSGSRPAPFDTVPEKMGPTQGER